MLVQVLEPSENGRRSSVLVPAHEDTVEVNVPVHETHVVKQINRLGQRNCNRYSMSGQLRICLQICSQCLLFTNWVEKSFPHMIIVRPDEASMVRYRKMQEDRVLVFASGLEQFELLLHISEAVVFPGERQHSQILLHASSSPVHLAERLESSKCPVKANNGIESVSLELRQKRDDAFEEWTIKGILTTALLDQRLDHK
jgi:hypothetical protein